MKASGLQAQEAIVPRAGTAVDPYAMLAVRALCSLLATVGALVIAVALAERGAGVSFESLQPRLAMGGLLGAGGVLAAVLARRGWQRAAAALALLLAFGAIVAHAWLSGLGTHALSLAATALVIVVAGILVNLPTALAMTGLSLVAVIGFVQAEMHRLIPGAAAAGDVTLEARTLSYVLLAIAGLLTAWIVRRQLLGNVARAHEHEHRLSRLIALGNDFTWETDPKGGFTSLSPSFETHTGRTIAEFLRAGRPGGPEVVRDAQWELLRADLRARRVYRERVIHFVCADGTDVFLIGSGEPVFAADGAHTGWWGVSRDATGEMLAQRELQRSQAMLDRLVRLSPDAICVASLRNGRVLLANPAFLQLTQLPESEVMGRNGIELGLWRDETEMLALGHAIRGQGWVRDHRTTAWLRNGEARAALMTAAAFDWDGEEVAVITTRDVTETERAKQEADAILDNAVVGVCLVRQHRLVRVNPQLERMLGRPIGSLVGKPTDVLFRDREKFDEFVQSFEGRQAAGDTIDIERRTVRADGGKILLRLRGRAVDPRRRETGTIWVIEDITERRRAELELAEAKHEAEAASRAKSSFLATMSHEIRTPLSGVLGLARLLQDPSLGEAARGEYLSHLVDAAELLNGIVSDVLDLSKIEAGHLQVEHIPFDLHVVVKSAFRTFSPLGRERGLEMSCKIAEGAPREVLGDPGRVRQILANYLSNALKFTSIGSIVLTLRAAGEGRARFEVRDTGIGVEALARDQLFLPFTQADSSTTRRFGGSGLGLSICRELARLMGGEVGVDSDGRRGSTFWAELPLEPAGEDDMSTIAGTLDEPPQPLAGMRVLLAEDNPVNRLIVGAMLGRLGAQVVEAADGAAALAQATQDAHRLHAVLMDLHMPEIDGLEATRRLRAQPVTAALPIIALSAAVLDAERAQAQAAGMNGFVGKPAAEGDLLRVLWPYAPAYPGWQPSV